MKKWMLPACLCLVLGAAGSALAQQVVMNEIFSRGTTGNMDWIELYNPGAADVRLAGYKIYDIGGHGGTKPKKQFPPSAVIAAKGFYVIVTDTNETGDGSDFGLSASGELVWLEDSLGAIIDTVTFGVMTATQSWSRIPDGGAWQLANTKTRGATNGSGLAVEKGLPAPERFVLAQNYPNPFNPSTTIRYALPQRSAVTLGVYNLIGQEVVRLVQGEQEAGYHEVRFDASALSSGIYLYRLTAGSSVQTRKLTLVK